MADNVSITPGVGATIATDEVTINGNLVQVQRIKLTESAEGSGAELTKREDDAHTSGDPGFQMLAVRKDTAASTAGSDGDYHPLLVDSSGRLHVNIGSMPAAARTTDAIAAALQTDAIMNGATALTPKFFSESVTASDTDEELVAAVTSKKIRVLALVAQAGGTATDMTFESGGSTRKHKIPAGANGGQVLPFNPAGWFETASGESLTVTTGLGSTCEISGVYVEV